MLHAPVRCVLRPDGVSVGPRETVYRPIGVSGEPIDALRGQSNARGVPSEVLHAPPRGQFLDLGNVCAMGPPACRVGPVICYLSRSTLYMNPPVGHTSPSVSRGPSRRVTRANVWHGMWPHRCALCKLRVAFPEVGDALREPAETVCGHSGVLEWPTTAGHRKGLHYASRTGCRTSPCVVVRGPRRATRALRNAAWARRCQMQTPGVRCEPVGVLCNAMCVLSGSTDVQREPSDAVS